MLMYVWSGCRLCALIKGADYFVEASSSIARGAQGARYHHWTYHCGIWNRHQSAGSQHDRISGRQQ